MTEERPGRQPAYDAVYAVIAQYPPRSTDDYGQAAENARVWRAVEAALDAMQQESDDARAEAKGARDDYEQLKGVNAELADERDRLKRELDEVRHGAYLAKIAWQR